MPQPFFDLPDCPEATAVDVPPAIEQIGLLSSCDIPQTPPPVFQCPLPALPYPGIIGPTIFLIPAASAIVIPAGGSGVVNVSVLQAGTPVVSFIAATVYNQMQQPTTTGATILVGSCGDGSFLVITQSCPAS